MSIVANPSDLPFVLVEWLDAHSDLTETTAADARLKHSAAKMFTAGWLMFDDEEGVTLFNEVCPEDDSYRGRSFVPRGMIKSVTKVRLTKERKPKSTPPDESPMT